MEFPWFQGEPVWELARVQPQLHAAIRDQVPQLAGLLTDLSSHFPAQTQPVPGQWGAYQRPRSHWRAFYYSIGPHSVLAVKGSEAHSQDFSAMLDVMARQSASLSYSIARPGAPHRHSQAVMSVLERFLFIENKLPGVVTLGEALSQAQRSCQFQAAHLRQHGQLARVPLPLLVHRIHPGQTGQIVSQICSRVEADHHPRVQALATDGLGVLIYWYPALPLRVAHLEIPPLSAQVSLQQRLSALGHGDLPGLIVDRWTQLLARMLCLGYVPADPLSSLQGLCLEAHNLTLDGGMVDLDSLRPMASFPNQAHVQLALERSLEVLTQSLIQFLSGDPAHLTAASGAVREQVARLCREAGDRGHLMPEPLARFLNAQSAFDSLVLSLQSSLDLE
ncbi:hypothetical protein IV102_08680 [bacterium]|nr:hypothetical protein [bacterium]